MSVEEIVVLVFIVTAFAAFALTLAWVSQGERLLDAARKRGSFDRRNAVGSVHRATGLRPIVDG